MTFAFRTVFSLFAILSIIFPAFPAEITRAASPVEPSQISLSGRVTDGSGAGMEGVSVQVEGAYKVCLPLVVRSGAKETAPAAAVEAQTAITALTDAEGYYNLPELPDGQYRLWVEKGGIEFTPAEVLVNESNSSQDFQMLVLPAVIPATTRTITDLTNQYLVSIVEGVYTYSQSTPEIQNLAVGDVLVSEVSEPLAPNGYLRKVTGVSFPAGQVVANTEPALLEEAIEDGTGYLKETLSPAKIDKMVALPGVSLAPVSPNEPLTFYYEVNNVVLLDVGGNKVTANGSITFNLEYEVYSTFDGLSLRNFTFSQKSSVEDTLEITAAIDLASLEEEVILASLVFQPVTLQIGPLPVVMVPQLDVVVGVNGSVKVGISAGVSHNLTLRAGASYSPLHGWQTYQCLVNEYDYSPPHATLEASLKGYFGARLNLYLYGVAGPYVTVAPYLELKVTPLEVPWWSLYAGLEVPVGFRVNDLLDKVIDLEDFELFAIGVKQRIAYAYIPGEMVEVPAGEFLMGCDINHNYSGGCIYPDELPLHAVYLSAFKIDRYEVTNAQYAVCVGEGVCEPPDEIFSNTVSDYFVNSSYANFPVIYVSWDDAATYCAWAGKRLPTEAEWEKAARGPTPRAFPWGDAAPNCTLANFLYATNSYCSYDPMAVGSHPDGASPYGVMDMAGNVGEWVSDWYDSAYYADSPYSNPTGPAETAYKILRGGSFYNNWSLIRTAYRNEYLLANSSDRYGFRCAQSLP